MIFFFLSVSVYLPVFLCSCWSKRWWSRSSWGVRPTWTWPRTPVTQPWLSTLASPRWNVWLSPTSTCPKSLWLGTSLPTLCCTKVKRFSPRKDWKIRIAGFSAETASPFCVQPQPVRNVPNLNYAEASHCQYHLCHIDIWATIFFWCQFWVLCLWRWPTDTFPIYSSWFSVGDVMIALALQLNT